MSTLAQGKQTSFLHHPPSPPEGGMTSDADVIATEDQG